MGLCLVHCDFTPEARLSFLVRDRDGPLKSQASPQKSNIPEAEPITKMPENNDRSYNTHLPETWVQLHHSLCLLVVAGEENPPQRREAQRKSSISCGRDPSTQGMGVGPVFLRGTSLSQRLLGSVCACYVTFLRVLCPRSMTPALTSIPPTQHIGLDWEWVV